MLLLALLLLSGWLGQGSEVEVEVEGVQVRPPREVGHRLQGLYWRPPRSEDTGDTGAGGAAWLTRLVRAEEVAVPKECRAGSPLVDQMELLNGADGAVLAHGLLLPPRMEVVGGAAVAKVEVVVGQELPVSVCQMEEVVTGV